MRLRLLAAVLAVGFIIAGILIWQANEVDAPTGPDETALQPVTVTETQLSTITKQFTGQEFYDLQTTALLPNVQQLTTEGVAFDFGLGEEADAYVRAKAIERGYRLSSVPAGPIVRLDEPYLFEDEDDLLQPQAKEAWELLRVAARADGIELNLSSGYRSVETQANLFATRLQAAGVSATAASGNQDAAIDNVLAVTAPPGYSRHHSGYTLDFICGSGAQSFEFSDCYDWISASNFEQAKLVGMIPSYPEGTPPQGPDPEAWEFVWVGKNATFEVQE